MDASHLLELFLGLGLFGMALAALAEKLAPIVPSYVMLMLLGMTVPDGEALVLTFLATVTGSLAGSLIWYGVGRAIGGPRVEAIVARFGKYVFLSPHVYRRLASTYRRNHFRVTVLGQIVPVARIYLALPAGVVRLRPIAFAAATALGIMLWNAPFLTLGFLLRGGDHDPVRIGFWMSAALILAETTIMCAARFYMKFGRRSERINLVG